MYLQDNNEPTNVSARGVAVSIDNNSWALLLEQSMLVLIIVARWLMPKGELTREQLSGLLLSYLGTASDVVDFFSVLSENNELLKDMIFVFTIMSVWTWSMMQFNFVVTYTKAGQPIGGNKVEPSDSDVEQVSVQPKRGCARARTLLHGFVASELWSIFVSIVMQDGPYVVVRLTCIFYWNIRTYTNYFFTFKNFMMLVLQIYRIVAVYQQNQEKKGEEHAPITQNNNAKQNTNNTGENNKLWL